MDQTAQGHRRGRYSPTELSGAESGALPAHRRSQEVQEGLQGGRFAGVGGRFGPTVLIQVHEVGTLALCARGELVVPRRTSRLDSGGTPPRTGPTQRQSWSTSGRARRRARARALRCRPGRLSQLGLQVCGAKRPRPASPAHLRHRCARRLGRRIVGDSVAVVGRHRHARAGSPGAGSSSGQAGGARTPATARSARRPGTSGWLRVAASMG